MNELRTQNSGIRLSDSASLTDSVDFSLLASNLSRDVESAIRIALAENIAFPAGREPLSIFRETLSASIRDIEFHPKGILFQEFLRKGPYESSGAIPKLLESKRLSDDETAAAITFIYSHMDVYKLEIHTKRNEKTFLSCTCSIIYRNNDGRLCLPGTRIY
jgi:hypothetical protein